MSLILDSSRRNNERLGVTGALLFTKGWFAQILEGPPLAISETFERIQRDIRHSPVIVLEYCKVERPSFPHWSMAFIDCDTRDKERFQIIGASSGFDPAHLTAETVYQTLHRLVREEETTA